MRIALVHMRHAAAGGTERYLNLLAAHLAEVGHDMTILCRTHENPPHPRVAFEVLRPIALGSAWRMWSFASAVERRLRSAQYDLVYGLGRTWTQDVIRLGGGCHASYLEYAHPARSSAWTRSFDQGRLKHRLALAIERRALAEGAAARIVVNSDMVGREVQERHGVSPERIAVIRNGVELERFAPGRERMEILGLRREWGLEGEHLVLLFVGTGYARKGLDRLLDALPEVCRQRPQVRLVVVGYDSGRARFERLARRRGVASRVRFLGGRRDVERIYAAADVFVLPTRYDPFANATLEALASGLPVVTSARNGAAELITQGREGTVLAEPGSRAALVEALLAWTEQERAHTGGEAARRLAEQNSAARCLELSTKLLEQVAAAKRN